GALAPALEALVARLLAKSAGDRPETMRAVCGELDALLAAAPDSDGAVAPAPVQAGRTVAYQSTGAGSTRVETTLRAASAERVDAVAGDGAAGGRPRRTFWTVAVVAVALLAGGGGLWRAATRSRSNDVAAVDPAPPGPPAPPAPAPPHPASPLPPPSPPPPSPPPPPVTGT